MNKIGFLVVLLLAGCTHKNTYMEVREKNDNAAIATLSAAPNYSCFAWKYNNPSFYPWQKGYTKVTYSWMVIQKNKQAMLIAQPETFCEEHNAKESDCVYWLRTVDFKDWWLPSNPEIVKCPSHLTKAFILNYVKEHYSDEIDVEAL